MTRKEREEAIRCLSVHSSTNGSGLCTDEQHYKAKQMAIQALSQEPCTDAVSKKAVLNAIEREDKWLLAAKGHNGLTEIAFSGLKARVDALPSVTPSITRDIEKSNFSQEQYLLDTDSAYQIGYEKGKKDSRCKGKWIYRREDKYSCSKCGTTTSVDESGIDEKPMYKFCPYCGAEMVGEKE